MTLAGFPDAAKRVWRRGGCALWDAGGEIALFEIATDFGVIDHSVIEGLGAAIEAAERGYGALVLASDNPLFFSAGASVAPFIRTIEDPGEGSGRRILEDGLEALLALKRSRAPSVVLAHGAAMSGGCELALCADRIVAEEAALLGFREVWAGLVPGWGGATRLLSRLQAQGASPDAAALDVFRRFAAARLDAGSAARSGGLLTEADIRVPDRAQLLATALREAATLAEEPKSPPQDAHISPPGPDLRPG